MTRLNDIAGDGTGLRPMADRFRDCEGLRRKQLVAKHIDVPGAACRGCHQEARMQGCRNVAATFQAREQGRGVGANVQHKDGRRGVGCSCQIAPGRELVEERQHDGGIQRRRVEDADPAIETVEARDQATGVVAIDSGGNGEFNKPMVGCHCTANANQIHEGLGNVSAVLERPDPRSRGPDGGGLCHPDARLGHGFPLLDEARERPGNLA